MTEAEPGGESKARARARRLKPADRQRLAALLGAMRDKGGPKSQIERLLAELTGEPTTGERRLVVKLEAAGRLKASFIVKALRERRLGLFAAALAKLGPYEERAVRAALASPDRPELLALALAGIGIDESAFPDLLERVRGLSGGRPGGGRRGSKRASYAFGPFDAATKALAFRLASNGA